jgi:type II pantothenate kinase
MIVAGLDVGGTTTGAVCLRDGKVEKTLSFPTLEPAASAERALAELLRSVGGAVGDLQGIAITGARSPQVPERLLGAGVHRVEEFQAIGTGGAWLMGLERAVVASMGTGTALVGVDRGRVRHLGGSGVGGGTLLGLARRILGTMDFESIAAAAGGGELKHVDLLLEDLRPGALADLPLWVTVSNFGRLNGSPSRADDALGLINLVLQAIGVMAVLAARLQAVEDVVLVGRLTRLPQADAIFEGFRRLFALRFHIPAQAAFATVIGAALQLLPLSARGGR